MLFDETNMIFHNKNMHIVGCFNCDVLKIIDKNFLEVFFTSNSFVFFSHSVPQTDMYSMDPYREHLEGFAIFSLCQTR